MLTLLLLLPSARAATLTVGSSGTYSTVGAAITAAVDGDRIEVAAGLYTECLDFGGKDLVLVGAGASWSTLAGDGTCESALLLEGGETATISGFTLVNTAGRAISMDHAALLLQEVQIGGAGLDETGFYGGAIRMVGGELSVEGSDFPGNAAERGSSIYASDGAVLDVTDSSFTLGSASYAAIYLEAQSDTVVASALSIEGSTLSEHQGGALFAGEGATVVSRGSSWLNNVDASAVLRTIYLDTGASLSSEGDVFSGNRSDDLSGPNGGAINASRDNPVQILDGEFTDNGAKRGGAIYQGRGEGASLQVTGSVFEGNEASEHGSAIFFVTYDTSVGASLLEITGSSFYDNVDTAVYVYDSGDGNQVKIEDSVFEGNGGGSAPALHLLYADDVSLEDLSFTDNTTIPWVSDDYYGPGGAVAVEHVDVLDATRLSFVGNEAGSGGAVYIYNSGMVTIDASSFEDGYSVYYGGGINADTVDSLTVRSTSFVSNRSIQGGGALYLSDVSIVDVTGSSFCANDSQKYGAVYAKGTSSTWTNNLIVDNTAFPESEKLGGGLYWNGTSVTLANNTIIGNTAYSAGGVWLGRGAATVYNNIFAYNSVSGVYGTSSVALSYDDWYANAADVEGTLSLDTSTDGHSTADPGFVTYTSGGDCSEFDLSLAAGSALIDAGDPSVLDPDGSRSDIGAYGGPGAGEVDWDRDRTLAAEDCDDADASVLGELTGYEDLDGDGYGDPSAPLSGCTLPAGAVENALDCDDTNDAIWPGAAEIAGDGVDQDCDGEDLTASADTGDSSAGETGDSSAGETGDSSPGETGDSSPEVTGDTGTPDSEGSGDDGAGPGDTVDPGCSGGGGCAGGSKGALAWLSLPGLLALRRRRR